MLYHSSRKSLSTLNKLNRIYLASEYRGALLRQAEYLLLDNVKSFEFYLYEFEPVEEASVSEIQEYDGTSLGRIFLEMEPFDLVKYMSVAQDVGSVNVCAFPSALRIARIKKMVIVGEHSGGALSVDDIRFGFLGDIPLELGE